jgi:hypothetical protein
VGWGEENDNVIKMEINGAISIELTTKNKSAFSDGAKDNEDDKIRVATDSAMETINLFTAASHLSDLRHFAESINLPENDFKILDQFKRHLHWGQSRQVYVASDDTDTKEKLNSWDFSNSIKFGNVTV